MPWRVALVRLTTRPSGGKFVTIHAEGRIEHDKADVLDRECRRLRPLFETVRVELSEVGWVDGRGTAVLRTLAAMGVRLVSVPPLIREMFTELGGS